MVDIMLPAPRLSTARTRTRGPCRPAPPRPAPATPTPTIINSKMQSSMSSSKQSSSSRYLLCKFVQFCCRNDFHLNVTELRAARQIDRTDALLRGGAELPHPLATPTGEKTRRTYDFTKTFHVATSCHDAQASQGRCWLACIKL